MFPARKTVHFKINLNLAFFRDQGREEGRKKGCELERKERQLFCMLHGTAR